MGPIDINGWEVILLAVLGVFILGPERLPEYAAKLGRLVRQARVLAENARVQLRQQMGPEFENIDWASYDLRQYDPRRIVREALNDPAPDLAPDRPDSQGGAETSAPASAQPQEADPGDAGSGEVTKPVSTPPRAAGHDPGRPTPWDVDAT